MIFLPLETSCIEHWPVSILTSLICKFSDLINSLISQFEFVRNKSWARLFVNQKVDLNFYLQKDKGFLVTLNRYVSNLLLTGNSLSVCIPFILILYCEEIIPYWNRINFLPSLP